MVQLTGKNFIVKQSGQELRNQALKEKESGNFNRFGSTFAW